MNYLSQTLMAAAGQGCVPLVVRCLQQPDCDVNDADPEGRTALMYAACGGHLQCVRLCLQQPDCDVNMADCNGDTALMHAARKVKTTSDCCDLILSELLQNESIEINEVPGVHGSALVAALVARETTAAETLVADKRCDVNVRVSSGCTPLIFTARNSQAYDDKWSRLIVQLMARPDINTHLVNDDGHTAVEDYINRRTLSSPNFNLSDSVRQTLMSLGSGGAPTSDHALATAVSFSSVEACEVLLENGFHPDSAMPSCNAFNYFNDKQKESPISDRETALHCAVTLNSLAKVSLLLRYGPDLSAKWRGMTPLELAIAYNTRPEILELLSNDMP